MKTLKRNKDKRNKEKRNKGKIIKTVKTRRKGNKQTIDFIYKIKINNKLIRSQKIKKTLELFHSFFLSYQKKMIKYDSNFPILTITNYEKKESKDKTRFFIFITTRPYNNHPFSVFGRYDDNVINIMIPLGNKKGQIGFRNIKQNLKLFNMLEKEALYKLLKFSLKIREFNFISPTNTKEINCSNIKSCQEEVNLLFKHNKQYNMNTIFAKYQKKILKIIKNYFTLLKNKNYIEAKKYITEKPASLKNMFYNSKDIIGHLIIFIEIYKCIDEVKITL